VSAVRARACGLFALSLLACGGSHRPASVAQAALRVVAVPETAHVAVDEQFVGAARVLAVRPATLAVGKHRVTVQAPDYFPHDLDVDLPRGVTTLEIKLRPIPP
jgi:hypothetical protein